MKAFEVRFDSGKEVLNAYWGYLSDGGLVIQDRSELDVGDAVALKVRIDSSRSDYDLAGKVVRRQSDSGHAVIAFDPGQPHDLMLSEALAETENVPARRHHRYDVNLCARLAPDHTDAAIAGRLVNISREGCCVRLEHPDGGRLTVGSNLDIQAGNFSVGGRVVWQRNRERGVRFESSESERREDSKALLDAYLRSLDR